MPSNRVIPLRVFQKIVNQAWLTPAWWRDIHTLLCPSQWQRKQLITPLMGKCIPISMGVSDPVAHLQRALVQCVKLRCTHPRKSGLQTSVWFYSGRYCIKRWTLLEFESGEQSDWLFPIFVDYSAKLTRTGGRSRTPQPKARGHKWSVKSSLSSESIALSGVSYPVRIRLFS